jgi:hypothetical protein
MILTRIPKEEMQEEETGMVMDMVMVMGTMTMKVRKANNKVEVGSELSALCSKFLPCSLG